MKYTLKNGVVLWYDEPKHTYKIQDKNGKWIKIPSVTGITSRGLIKPGLTDWKVNFPLSTAKKLINEKLNNNEAIDRLSLEKIFTEASESTDKIMKEAGRVGSVVHGLIEDFLKDKEIPTQTDKRVVNCWNLFLKWWEKQGYQVVEIEKKLVSKSHLYGGTLDLVVKDKDGNLVLIDIKTSNQISFDYLLQLNAYWFAYEEETGSKISKAMVVRLPKSDSKMEIQEVPLNNKLLNAFIGAKNIMTSMETYWD